MIKICFVTTCIILTAPTICPRQIQVPADFPRIQAAVDSAVSGDTIILADGIYFERIDLKGKAIVLASEFLLDSDTIHITNTVIDGDTSITPTVDTTASVILVADILGGSAVIMGITIQKGEGSRLDVISTPYSVGGGILCVRASALIRNCVFRNNSSGNLGGGIFVFSALVQISNCLFDSNESSNGGGLCVYGSSGSTIDSCLFLANSASEGGGANISFGQIVLRNNNFSGNSAFLGGGLLVQDNLSSIIDCDFQDNQGFKGGGMYCFQGADGDIINCDFYNNTASLQNNQQAVGGAICCLASSPLIRNCTMHSNSADSGGGIYVNNSALPDIENCIVSSSKKGKAISCNLSLQLSVLCTNIFGNVGGDWVGCLKDRQFVDNNLAVDPLYCQPNSPNLGLKSNSPCLAANNSCQELIGSSGPGCMVTDVGEFDNPLPKDYVLLQNYPNPFNPSTKIEFSMPNKERVKVLVSNILGETVAILLDGTKSAGNYSVEWNGQDKNHVPLSSGVYFYTIVTDNFFASKKMILLK